MEQVIMRIDLLPMRVITKLSLGFKVKVLNDILEKLRYKIQGWHGMLYRHTITTNFFDLLPCTPAVLLQIFDQKSKFTMPFF